MKAAILTPALVAAIALGMISPASAQYRNTIQKMPGQKKGSITLDQSRWRNGTAGSQAPSPNSGNANRAQSGNQFRRQVQPSGGRTRGAANGNSNRNAVQSRQPSKLDRLRALKNQSRTATRGVGKPYAQGSRYGQLINKFENKATTRSTAGMKRPNSNPADRIRYSENQTARTAQRNRAASNNRTPKAGQVSKTTRGTAGAKQGRGVVKFRQPGNGPAGSNQMTPKERARQLGSKNRTPKTGQASKSTSRPRPTTNTRTANSGRTAARGATTGRTASNARNGAKAASTAKNLGKVAKATGVGLVAGAVLKDTTGIDPIELGIDAVGDAFNGTNNAQQSLDNVENSFNGSLTKQVFTDPEAAATRVKNDLNTAARDVDNFVKDPGKAIGSLFAP